MNESAPVGFTQVTVLRSKTPVQPAEPTVVATIFWPAPLRIVPKESKGGTLSERLARIIAPEPAPISASIRAKCVNPPDPLEVVADWKRRKAAHDAIMARRLQRIDWYLNTRIQRSAT